MRRKAVVAALAFAALTLAAFGQSKPNFSGTWKLNVDKSDFGPVPGPSAETEIIDQTDKTMKVSVAVANDEGKIQYDMMLVLDGSEIDIPADSAWAHPGTEVTMQSVAASWDGSALIVNQKLTYGNEPVTGASRYSLSDDGKVLTVDSNYTSAMGDATRTFVFEKQDASAAPATSATASASDSPAAAPAASSPAATASTPSASSLTPMAASPASAPAATAAPAAVPSAPAGLAVAADSGSAAHANLSGTWVLDAAKSDFGPMPPPDSRTETIDDKDSSVTIHIKQTGGPMGGSELTLDLTTDGKTVSNSTVMGNDAKTTAHWDGASLVVNTQVSAQGDTATLVTTYTLSADGSTLTALRAFSGPMGDAQMKFVYTKK
ncbi:MAG TPA: hypothetical protein VMH00_07805 [Candidatus Limnocylindrales bacterium]|nr:hypothetical protein [Candidatus Limnocylindrales bacterium]